MVSLLSIRSFTCHVGEQLNVQGLSQSGVNRIGEEINGKSSHLDVINSPRGEAQEMIIIRNGEKVQFNNQSEFTFQQSDYYDTTTKKERIELNYLLRKK